MVLEATKMMSCLGSCTFEGGGAWCILNKFTFESRAVCLPTYSYVFVFPCENWRTIDFIFPFATCEMS